MLNLATTHPFPGLRAFESSESEQFFGRNQDIHNALRTIAVQHLVAIVGRSGCGKTSLVHAGLLPALDRNRTTETGSPWLVLYTRPGSEPLRNLAEALTQEDGYIRTVEGQRSSEDLIRLFRQSPNALVDLLNTSTLTDNRHRLLLVDPFEEIYRPGAGLFDSNNCYVQQLLSIARYSNGNVAAVLIMRSDFIGECDQFPNLSEALSSCIRFVPRMSEDQLFEAIVQPLARIGAQIEPALVSRMIEDMRGLPDQLSLMQHALKSCWSADLAFRSPDSEGAIGLKDYEYVGGISGSLNFTAEQSLASLNPEQQRIAESIFRTLGTRDKGGYLLRRPTRLVEIARIAQTSIEEASGVANVFIQEGFISANSSFVLVSSDSVLDISHEALLRNWHRLTAWIDEEYNLGNTYQRHLYITLQLSGRGGSRSSIMGWTWNSPNDS